MNGIRRNTRPGDKENVWTKRGGDMSMRCCAIYTLFVYHPVQACVVPMRLVLFSVNRSLSNQNKQQPTRRHLGASDRNLRNQPCGSGSGFRGCVITEHRSRELDQLTACRICLPYTPLDRCFFPSEIPPSTAEHRSGMDGAICIRERDRPLPPTNVSCRMQFHCYFSGRRLRSGRPRLFVYKQSK